mmetsp:Transcript_26355/g.102836  ORF Transcript_26355/g.102836 Transcript_26355/m.102836 type:complete len:92 (+) Transcript_26355:52-327(+)
MAGNGVDVASRVFDRYRGFRIDQGDEEREETSIPVCVSDRFHQPFSPSRCLLENGTKIPPKLGRSAVGADIGRRIFDLNRAFQIDQALKIV